MLHCPTHDGSADLVAIAAAFTDRLDTLRELIAISDTLPAVPSHPDPYTAVERLLGRLLDEAYDLARVIVATPAREAASIEAKRVALETYRRHLGCPDECLETELALSLLADFLRDSERLVTGSYPRPRPRILNFLFARGCAPRARTAWPFRQRPRTAAHAPFARLFAKVGLSQEDPNERP